jgi:DoxX-like family
MSGSNKWLRIAGIVCHILVAAVMLLACSGLAFGFAPAQIVEQMAKFGLSDKRPLIGFGGLITGVLLLIPRTWLLGALGASSYWGGAICMHMSHGESYMPPAVLLLLTWAGALLRSVPAPIAAAKPSEQALA